MDMGDTCVVCPEEIEDLIREGIAMKTQSCRGIGFVYSLVGWIVLGSGGVAMAVPFAGGTGEPNDPYQIATVQQLIGIGQDPNLLSRHFVLVADIDLDPNLPGGRVFDDALIAPDDNNSVGGHQAEALQVHSMGRAM